MHSMLHSMFIGKPIGLFIPSSFILDLETICSAWQSMGSNVSKCKQCRLLTGIISFFVVKTIEMRRYFFAAFILNL